MYRSKLASLIEDAMNECITFGQGITRHESTSVQADWTEENEIQITIFENHAVRFSYTETVNI